MRLCFLRSYVFLLPNKLITPPSLPKQRQDSRQIKLNLLLGNKKLYVHTTRQWVFGYSNRNMVYNIKDWPKYTQPACSANLVADVNHLERFFCGKSLWVGNCHSSSPLRRETVATGPWDGFGVTLKPNLKCSRGY